MSTKKIVAKVSFFGEIGVGKTCLIKRYVENRFESRYTFTIGSTVTKKVLSVMQFGTEVTVTLLIWDIMGQKGFLRLLEDAYFTNSNVGVGVCDITRRHTLEDLEDWFVSIHRISGPIPIILLANKADLRDRAEITEDMLREYSNAHGGIPYFYVSSKTGENIERPFIYIAELIASMMREKEGVGLARPERL